MISKKLVEDALRAPDEWEDTEAQARLRDCLTGILSGHNEIDTVVIAGELISLMRDQLMSNAATVRRAAARAAREDLGMMPQELAKATHQTRQTISRLLTESRPT